MPKRTTREMRAKWPQWTYKRKKFVLDDPSYVGFVYEITNRQTGMKYIGLKYFYRGNGWIDYWGSSNYLKDDIKQRGHDKFRKRILHLCKTTSEMEYREAEEIFKRQALLDDQYYNQFINVCINSNALKSMKDYESSKITTGVET